MTKRDGNSKKKDAVYGDIIIRIYYLLFMVLWGMIMYKMIPSESMDLHGYYERFIYYGLYFKNYKEFFEYVIGSSGDFIFHSIIYFMGVFEINKHLLPVIIMIFYYSTMLYMYMNSERNEQVKIGQGIIIVILAPCLVYPYLLLSVLRFPLAVAFFSLGLFFSFEKNSPKIGILLYLIAYFTHAGIMLGIISLFVYKFLNTFKRIKKITIATILILYLIIRFRLDLLIEFFSKIGLPAVARKLSISSAEGASIGVGRGPLVVLIGTFLIINLIIYKDEKNELIRYLKVLSMVVILSTSLTLILLVRYTWLFVFFLPYISKKIEMSKIHLLLFGLDLILFLYVYRLYMVEHFTIIL